MTGATAAGIVDVRALPSTGETIAHRDGGQFPVLALTSEGTMVAVLRGGAGHLGLAGRVEIIRSFDAGHTWSPSQVVADSERDDRNPALGVAPDGSLVLAYHCQGSYDETGTFIRSPAGHGEQPPVTVMMTRSTDDGLTWTEPESIEDPQVRYGSPFGKIVSLSDGTLLMAVYVHRPLPSPGGAADQPTDASNGGSFVIRSHDGGKTWGEPTRIAPWRDETGLLALPDDSVLAVARGSDPEQALWATRSRDSGRTWSPPKQITGARQHPADLVVLSSGDVLLTYGNRNPPYRIEGKISHDGGETWRDDLLLTFSGPLYGHAREPRPTDLGYPSSVVRRDGSTGSGATIYYYNPFPLVEAADWRKGGTAAGFYQTNGYRAVAVTWDEAELLAAIGRA